MEGRWGWVIGGVLAVVGGIWWFNNQSAAATLKDGVYDCVAVYVNGSNKYEILVDDNQQQLSGNARVQGGKVVSYSVPNYVLGWSDQPDLSVTNSGREKFRVTDAETYYQNHYAMACESSN